MSNLKPVPKRPRLDKGNNKSGTITMEGKLPEVLCLAVPFLAVGDLPILASVSKAAQDLARFSYKLRIMNGDYHYCISNTKSSPQNKQHQQELIAFENNIPPCYDRSNKVLDFRQVHSIPPDLDGGWKMEEQEDGSSLVINIRNHPYKLPAELKGSSPNYKSFKIQHCSVVNDTIVITGFMDSMEHYFDSGRDETRALWAILYVVGNSEPTHVENLVTVHPFLAVCEEADGNFGAAVRSGNGRVLVVITELANNCLYEELFGYRIENCDLTVYHILEGGKLETRQTLIVQEWCDTEYGFIDPSLSPCGRLLSIRINIDQYDSEYWELWDLEQTNAATASIFHRAVSPDGREEVEKIFFTADNELIVDLDKYIPRQSNDDNQSSMSQYVEKYLRFVTTEVRPFCKRIIVR